MKIRPSMLFAAILLILCAPLHGAKAPKLETLLGEYKKARGDVLGKLNTSYAAQADTLAEQFQAAANLDGADRAQQFAKRLRDPDAKNDVYAALATNAAADPLAELESNYAQARQENLRNVYVFYASTAASLRQQLLKSNDKAGAAVMDEFLQKIKPSGLALVPQPTLAPAKAHTSASR